jgi:tRNA A-37 threonylcarbamoyl transferase component Bud32
MPIASGTKLGPYEILGAVGAGGMGEVYRAKDTRLERTVAIKVLPETLKDKPELQQRLEREAKTISSLSHPNICTLYDIGQQEGVHFLVMEYLEGETLEQRLSRGALPPEQTLRIAVEIAEALEKAHRQGVTHRDLKPGNVMLTKSGAKLMDFGLAKLTDEPPPMATALSEMATQARKLTTEGSIVGTFQYMAPEQLEGQEADARTDLFALGEVIHEMATGKPAFSGKTKASLIASILSSEPPPISTVQPMTPPALDRIVKRCLAKDPDERWQSASDLAAELRWIAEGGSQMGVPAPVVKRRKLQQRVGWLAAAAALLLAMGGYWLAYQQYSRSYAKPIRSSIDAPEKMHFAFTGDAGGPPVLSPDGTRIAFAAVDADGKQLLWVRALDSLAAQPLQGTDNATFPFWSPDGRYLGFFANGKLTKVEASGGPVLALCDAPIGRGGDWNRDDVILFSPTFRAGVFKVSAAGGTPSPVTTLEGGAFTSNRWPVFLPDGKHFLYLAVHHENVSKSVVFLGSLDGGKPVQVMESPSSFRYANGYLLFLRQGTLMAQKLDTSQGRLQGEPTPVAESVLSDDSVWRGVFDVSSNGLLIYQHGSATASQRLAWFDRTGKRLSDLEISTGFQTIVLSPDGKHLAVQGNPTSDIWNYDMARGVHIRLTFDPATHTTPIWSPDGKWVAYVSAKNVHNDIFRKPSDGTGSEEPLVTSPVNKLLGDWSRDGKYIVYIQTGEKGGSDFWVLPLFGEHKPFPVLQTTFNNGFPAFSPDGRWLLYTSDESGQSEIYVMPFQGAAGKWQISTKGGVLAAWRGDSKEIFYLANDSRVMAVPVSAQGNQFQVGEAKPLFRLIGSSQSSGFFLVSGDGQRFLSAAPTEEKSVPMTLVFNWIAAVKK